MRARDKAGSMGYFCMMMGAGLLMMLWCAMVLLCGPFSFFIEHMGKGK